MKIVNKMLKKMGFICLCKSVGEFSDPRKVEFIQINGTRPEPH